MNYFSLPLAIFLLGHFSPLTCQYLLGIKNNNFMFPVNIFNKLFCLLMLFMIVFLNYTEAILFLISFIFLDIAFPSQYLINICLKVLYIFPCNSFINFEFILVVIVKHRSKYILRENLLLPFAFENIPFLINVYFFFSLYLLGIIISQLIFI